MSFVIPRSPGLRAQGRAARIALTFCLLQGNSFVTMKISSNCEERNSMGNLWKRHQFKKTFIHVTKMSAKDRDFYFQAYDSFFP